MKYSLEVKVKAVKRVIEDKLSARKVAKEIGTSKSVIQNWVGLYNYHGIEGLSIKRNSYEGSFKLQVIEHMLENNLSLFKTSIIFKIPSFSTVREWKQIYLKKGAEILCMGEEKASKKDINLEKKQVKT